MRKKACRQLHGLDMPGNVAGRCRYGMAGHAGAALEQIFGNLEGFSSGFGGNSIFNDRYLYLPSIGLALAGVAWARPWARWKTPW